MDQRHAAARHVQDNREMTEKLMTEKWNHVSE